MMYILACDGMKNAKVIADDEKIFSRWVDRFECLRRFREMTQYHEHQLEAFEAIAEHRARGVTRMRFDVATSGGKTCVFASQIHEAFRHGASRCVLVASKTQLLQQTVQEMEKFGLIPNCNIYALASCLKDVTHPRIIKLSLRQARKIDTTQPFLVMVLSRSYEKVRDVVEPLDLMVIDEVHNNVPEKGLKDITDINLDEADCLEKLMDVRDRVAPTFKPVLAIAREFQFYTATERLRDSKGGTVLTAGNEYLYGPLVFAYPPSIGISTGVLCPYRMVIALVWDRSPNKARKVPVPLFGRMINSVFESYTRRIESLPQNSRASSKKKIFSFLNNVKACEAFSDILDKDHVGYNVVATGAQRNVTRCIEGFRESQAPISMISSVGVLKEGTNVPEVDTILICEPKNSDVDIKQIIGRGLRRCEGKDKLDVVIPLLIKPGESVEDACNKGTMKVIINVLTDIMAHVNLPEKFEGLTDEERIELFSEQMDVQITASDEDCQSFFSCEEGGESSDEGEDGGVDEEIVKDIWSVEEKYRPAIATVQQDVIITVLRKMKYIKDGKMTDEEAAQAISNFIDEWGICPTYHRGMCDLFSRYHRLENKPQYRWLKEKWNRTAKRTDKRENTKRFMASLPPLSKPIDEMNVPELRDYCKGLGHRGASFGHLQRESLRWLANQHPSPEVNAEISRRQK